MNIGLVIRLYSVFINFQPNERRSLLIKYGCYCVALFLSLRCLDFYGDPNSFTMQNSLSLTVMDFFNTTKYPPSLLTLFHASA